MIFGGAIVSQAHADGARMYVVGTGDVRVLIYMAVISPN